MKIHPHQQAQYIAVAGSALAALINLVVMVQKSGACPDTPCIVGYLFMLLPLLMAMAAGSALSGWLWSAPSLRLRWGARCVYALLMAANVYLLALAW
jgi:hypothetical protein